MAEVITGTLDASKKRFAIVAARWNALFADRLVEGAIEALIRCGASEDDICVYRCPGSFELAQVAAKVADPKRFDAVICLGVLIRGATPHFDFIASRTTSAIDSVGLASGIPVTYGVITCDTLEQAMERSGSKAGNKGEEAATAAIEMVTLYEKIGSHS